MKSLPILFSTPMIKALLEGRKTRSRRIVSPQPIFGSDGYVYEGNYNGFVVHDWREEFVKRFCRWADCESLWVRETFARLEADRFVYRADYPSIKGYEAYRWKPSIHMPRVASRITLKVENVRIERLHEITAEDAIEEGIELVNGKWKDYTGDFDGFEDTCFITSKYGENLHAEVCSFASLWSHINGFDSWQSNPYVYRIEFRKEVSHES